MGATMWGSILTEWSSLILRWLHVVAGSESNVVGLPLELLAEMLREFLAPGQ